MGWAQRAYVAEVERQYNKGKPVRIIVLKARQLGISTATEGIFFNWSFLHPGSNSLVVAHETPASEELFGKVQLFWDTWPFKSYYTLKYATKQNLHWQETRSRLRIATAKNVQSGRGSTLHAVHLSEFAFYPDPETLMLGLNQTIPHAHGTIVVIESTANGLGNTFHDMWNEAEEGGSDFVPLFFPWWRHPEYQIATTLTIARELTADERKLLRLGATFENIAWRRWAIINKAGGDVDMFMQEYPSSPEEAFITSGQPIFPHSKLKEVYDPLPGYRGYLQDTDDGGVKFVPDRSGNLTIYKSPSRRDPRPELYFVAGDPSQTVDGDPACIQVINRLSFEQVAVWHGRIDPYGFADEMIRVGKYYNGAMLCPEIEGGGQGTVARILTLGYPNVWQHRWADKSPGKVSISYGWSTNFQRKAWSVGQLLRLIIDSSIQLHDRITYNQLRNYVRHPNGEWGNSDPDIHDDSVMALAIGVTASIQEGPVTEPVRSGIVHDIYTQEHDDSTGYEQFGA